MRERLSAVLVSAGVVGVALLTLSSLLYRFSNPDLSETRLLLWDLSRWWLWLLAVAALLAGWLSLGKRDGL